MLAEVKEGETYLDGSGEPFKVVGLARHGHSKGGIMVVYQNLTKTDINPVPYTPLVATQYLFMKSFNEVPTNDD